MAVCFVVCVTGSSSSPSSSQKCAQVHGRGVGHWLLIPPRVVPSSLCSQSNNQDELFDQILGGRFEFMSPYWDGISASAQELIRGMLQVDVMRRLTARQVLQHPWLQQRGHAAGWQPEAWQVGLHFEERPRTSLETAGTLSTS